MVKWSIEPMNISEYIDKGQELNLTGFQSLCMEQLKSKVGEAINVQITLSVMRMLT